MINTVEREVEELIDRESLAVAIQMISAICFEKAEHVRSNWQDEPLARKWEKAGKYLDGVGASPKLNIF